MFSLQEALEKGKPSGLKVSGEEKRFIQCCNHYQSKLKKVGLNSIIFIRITLFLLLCLILLN